MYDINLIADTDSYKLGHPLFINPKLEHIYSYGEARVNSKYPETVAIGMNIILKKYFSKPILQEHLDEAIEVSIATHGFNPLNVEVWQRIIDEGGFLPIRIKAVPEGSKIPVDNVLFTIESTKDWFAKYLQGIEGLLMHLWYAYTTSTRSYNIYKSIKPYYEMSGDLSNLPFAVNDFGLRGGTTVESAEIAGMMHLMFFDGSDNMRASRKLRQFYPNAPLKGKSIYASEHSVALSYGRSGEKDYLKQMLIESGNNNVSIVIDTYDTFGFIKNVVGDKELKQMIIDKKGRIVFRPDSGNPLQVPLDVIMLLDEMFGSKVNDKGYRVLNHNIGVIQGDGMDEDSISELYRKLLALGYSADNLVTGSGGGLHQKDITRDTQRFAIKPSFGIIDGEEFNFKKNPATDTTKTSKSGRLKLHPTKDSFETISSNDTTRIMFNSYIDVLETVYENGVITYTPFDVVQERIKKYL